LLPLSKLAESQARRVRRCPSSPHQALLPEFCESDGGWISDGVPIESNGALRHNFDREQIAQTATKEGTIRRKHSDERGCNFMT
jgi:hypothetical protein